MTDYISRVSDYYARLIEQHGDTVRATDWGGEQQQKLRFDILLQSGALGGKSILDVGCGRGDLYAHLQERGYAGEYAGIDITPGMIDLASRRFPGIDFAVMNILEQKTEQDYDFILASGIFYLLQDDNKEFFRSMARRLYALCGRGVAFNMLSSLAGQPDEGEFLFDPDFVLRECCEITPFVTLRHEYKKNDFSIFMYRSEQIE